MKLSAKSFIVAAVLFCEPDQAFVDAVEGTNTRNKITSPSFESWKANEMGSPPRDLGFFILRCLAEQSPPGHRPRRTNHAAIEYAAPCEVGTGVCPAGCPTNATCDPRER